MNKKLKTIVSTLLQSEYTFNQDEMLPYCIDWRGKYEGRTNLVVFPKSLKSLMTVVRKCNQHNIKIVPQGGNTGLVGGSVPTKHNFEIVVSLKKLNKITQFDPLNSSIQIEAGCILENIQNFVQKKGFYFPISMGSRGNCQIGGNISTNAGGLNVIKYGNIRSNILGLEAVTGDGQLISDLKDVKKNNTGYDLKHLFIGAEGTLGIITKVNFKLFPLPKNKRVVLASFDSLKNLIVFFSKIKEFFNDLLSSFELINSTSFNLVIDYENMSKLLKNSKYYALVELSTLFEDENFTEKIEDYVYKISDLCIEIIISKSLKENKSLWKYREMIPIAERKINKCIKHDISVPLYNMEKFISRTEKLIKELDRDFEIINFGHLGDNNLHYNVFSKESSKNDKLIKKANKINQIIFENVEKLGGCFSAEHGIGQQRRNELLKFKSKNEILKMKKIKEIFDPKNILNPGKVI